jgi:hypothetical protein
LLHPAHVLAPGDVTAGAGVSGQLGLTHLPVDKTPQESQNRTTVQDLSVAPGVAPWGAARVGIIGSNEAGITYSGRTLRVDARHAFAIGKAALSVGVGASGVFAEAPGGGNARGVWGGGADLPVLIGVRSTGDLFAFWFGPRAGFEIVSGQIQLSNFAGGAPLFDVDGKHFYAGLTAGMRAGFRHIHLALELNAAYHTADGTFRPTMLGGGVGAALPASSSSSVQQLSLTPAGALVVTF